MATERDPELQKTLDNQQEPETAQSTAQSTIVTPDDTADGRKKEGDVSTAMALNNEKPTLELNEERWAKLQVGGRAPEDAITPRRSLQPSPDIKERVLPPIPNEYAESETGESIGMGKDPPPIPQKDSAKAPSKPSPPRALTSISVTSSRNPVNGQSTFTSMVFVVQALETISSSKESRKRKYLVISCQKALEAIKTAAPQLPPDPEVVFEPLKLACETQNVQLTTTALDTIAKLISYCYLSVVPVEERTPPGTPITSEGATDVRKSGQQQQQQQKQQQKLPLIERAIETICECFQGEGTADQVQLQIIKALLAAVLNDKTVVHGAGLIKAIRQTYNIFLLSKSSPHQLTAQGTLTQMVHTVFERVKTRLAVKEVQLRSTGNTNASNTTINISTVSGIDGDDVSSLVGPDSEEGASASAQMEMSGDLTPTSQEKITLQSFENRKSFDDPGRMSDTTTVTRSSSVDPAHSGHGRSGPSDGTESQAASEGEDEDELFVKDAFVVFRSMCKLSDKSMTADQMIDIKCNGMRSKLLSLHLIHTILKSHMVVFTNPLVTLRSSSRTESTRFIHAVKQYLCLSLSRNAASAVSLVFEVCCEIFWLVLREMRVMMKVSRTFSKGL